MHPPSPPPRPRPGARALAALAFTAIVAGVASPRSDARADGPDDGSGDGSYPGQDEQIAAAGDAYADTDPSALTDFQPALDPHGTWADDASYGTVWTPNPDEVGSDFTPYVSAGHWGYDDDYVWMSDYSWGWAAFHYGRWVWLRDRGWAWIPGRLYSNAWVSWRVGDDATAYVGWAPAQPTWGWRDGVAAMLGFASFEPFVFCPPRDLFAPAVAPRVVGGASAAPVLAQTRPYVKASPVVGTPATPSGGPPPATIGIDAAHVTRVIRTEPSVARARQFARPSTALALGARPPVVHVVRPRMVVRQPFVQRVEPAARPTRRK